VNAPAYVDENGVRFAFDAPVNAVVWTGDAFAFALGDGAIAFAGPADADPQAVIRAHAEAALTAVAHRGGVISGGDDGRLVFVNHAGAQEWARERGWVECIAASPKTGIVAAGWGKNVLTFSADGKHIARFAHDSVVRGMTFDPTGKRLYCAHKDGVTQWMAGSATSVAKRLRWAGPHTDVVTSPDGRFLITSMQDASLHGWRLEDGTDFRMPQYPQRPKSLSFLDQGKLMATSGAEVVVVWPFVGPKGPMGQQAIMVGDPGNNVTRCAGAPTLAVVAAGYDNGKVSIFPMGAAQTAEIDGSAGSPVSGMAWSVDGKNLAFGREDGSAAIARFPLIEA
jgi:WD40 repeat protein